MLIAYQGTVSKAAILKQLRQHAKLDEIEKGHYWDSGKGCAVGCTIHSGQHVEYETRFGIPQMLARLEDCIFEGLPNGVDQSAFGLSSNGLNLTLFKGGAYDVRFSIKVKKHQSGDQFGSKVKHHSGGRMPKALR